MALRHAWAWRQRQFRNHLPEQPLDPLAFRLVPPAESQDAAGGQNTHALGQRGIGLWEMAQCEVADHGLERRVWEGQFRHLGHLEVDAGMLRVRERDHTGSNQGFRTMARFANSEVVEPCRSGTTLFRCVCARRSWRGPAGGRPVQVRGSARLVASVAARKVTTAAKRTQRLCGVGY